MKSVITFFVILNITASMVSDTYSQSINNTLGTNGDFLVKDASTTFFKIKQSDGSILIPSVSASSQSGSIVKGTNRFIHTYYAAGTNGKNTFIGIDAGNFTLSNTTSLDGSGNTGIGYQSLNSLTSGYFNSATGVNSLSANTTGNYNSGFGFNSLSNNISGEGNSAFGYGSLLSNSSGSYNAAFGLSSLTSNTTGLRNSAFGNSALELNSTSADNSAFGNYTLRLNSTGSSNSAFGSYAMTTNSVGYQNSAFGKNSLYYNSTGSFNSAFGYVAGSEITTGNNNLALGYDAQVPSGTSSNQVRIGNEDITYAGIQVAWTVTSDRKWKENIQTIPLGLNFISLLNPVSYTRKNDEKKKTEFGLIAQDVEALLKEYNITNSGMITIDEKGNYELRYNDLLSPMIKAIQELKIRNEKLKIEKDDELSLLIKENEELKKEMSFQIAAMDNRIKKYEETLNILIKEITIPKSENKNTLITLEKK